MRIGSFLHSTTDDAAANREIVELSTDPSEWHYWIYPEGTRQLTSVPFPERVDALPEQLGLRTSTDTVTSTFISETLSSLKSAVQRGQFDFMLSLKGVADTVSSFNHFRASLEQEPPQDMDIDAINEVVQQKNADTADHVVDALIPASYFNPVTMVKRTMLRSAFYQTLGDDDKITELAAFLQGAKLRAPTPVEKIYRRLIFSQMAHEISLQLNKELDTTHQSMAAEQLVEGVRTLTRGGVQLDVPMIMSLHREVVERQLIPWMKF